MSALFPRPNMTERSLPLHVHPQKPTIPFRRRPEERKVNRVLTRIDRSSILKRATYAHSIREREIITQPLTRHCDHEEAVALISPTYDQTHSVAKEVRRVLAIERPKTRTRVVAQLSCEEELKLIAYAYRVQGTRGLRIKTLFQMGARVSEFVDITADEVFFEEQMSLISKAKGGKSRYVLILA
jgi:integrase